MLRGLVERVRSPGVVYDVRFCLNSCEKRPGIVEVELEGFKA